MLPGLPAVRASVAEIQTRVPAYRRSERNTAAARTTRLSSKFPNAGQSRVTRSEKQARNLQPRIHADTRGFPLAFPPPFLDLTAELARGCQHKKKSACISVNPRLKTLTFVMPAPNPRQFARRPGSSDWPVPERLGPLARHPRPR